MGLLKPGTTTSTTDRSQDEEPDYRYTLANERTYLAWIRTAMAMLAAGVAAHQLLGLQQESLEVAISLVCFLLAALLAAGAFLRWRAADAAIRSNRPLTPPYLVPALALGLGLLTILAAAAMLWS